MQSEKIFFVSNESLFFGHKRILYPHPIAHTAIVSSGRFMERDYILGFGEELVYQSIRIVKVAHDYQGNILYSPSFNRISFRIIDLDRLPVSSISSLALERNRSVRSLLLSSRSFMSNSLSKATS